MKRKIVVALMILICFLLQCTVFKSLAFGGIVPNLMIILTSSFGFMKGRKHGLIIGFFSGLLIDIFFGEVIGFYSLIYMYIGYGNGVFNKIFYPEDIKLPIALISGSEMNYGFTSYFLLFLLRSRFQFAYYFIHVILPEIVYTILITMILYPLILWINQKLEKSEQRSAKKFV